MCEDFVASLLNLHIIHYLRGRIHMSWKYMKNTNIFNMLALSYKTMGRKQNPLTSSDLEGTGWLNGGSPLMFAHACPAHHKYLSQCSKYTPHNHLCILWVFLSHWNAGPVEGAGCIGVYLWQVCPGRCRPCRRALVQRWATLLDIRWSEQGPRHRSRGKIRAYLFRPDGLVI